MSPARTLEPRGGQAEDELGITGCRRQREEDGGGPRSMMVVRLPAFWKAKVKTATSGTKRKSARKPSARTMSDQRIDAEPSRSACCAATSKSKQHVRHAQAGLPAGGGSSAEHAETTSRGGGTMPISITTAMAVAPSVVVLVFW